MGRDDEFHAGVNLRVVGVAVFEVKHGFARRFCEYLPVLRRNVLLPRFDVPVKRFAERLVGRSVYHGSVKFVDLHFEIVNRIFVRNTGGILSRTRFADVGKPAVRRGNYRLIGIFESRGKIYHAVRLIERVIVDGKIKFAALDEFVVIIGYID